MLLGLYLFRKFAAATGVGLALGWSILVTLQALRIGHHLVGASPKTWGSLLLFSAPTVIVFVLPMAVGLALLFTLWRMGQAGELLAVATLGRSPLLPVLPALGVALIAGSAGWAAARAEPACLARLQGVARAGTRGAFIRRLAPRTFSNLGGGVSLFFARRKSCPAPNCLVLDDLFVVREDTGGDRALPSEIIVAKRARLQWRKGALHYWLEDGEAVQPNGWGGHRRIRFDRQWYSLPLPAVGAHWAYLSRRAGGSETRGVSVLLQVLALALWAAAVPGRKYRLSYGALASAFGMVLFTVSQALLEVGQLHRGAAILSPAILCCAASMALWRNARLRRLL